MFTFLRSLAIVVFCLFATQAVAQRAHVVRDLPGYECKMLNITEAQAMDPAYHTPYYSQPSASSPVAGYASMQVAVKAPIHTVNGFDEAIFPNGGTVWIQANLLRNYHSLADPSAKCVPALMSDGRQGFDYQH